MKLVFWRICRSRRAKTAFDGTGAKLYPGRWNHPDVPMVYCASSLSLATLEYFVHADPEDLPDDLVCIRAEVSGSVRTERVATESLPTGWRAAPGPSELADIGSEWASSMRSLLLFVPSAITPIEDNVLVNPRHPEMSKLRRHAPVRFAFDPRMRK